MSQSTIFSNASTKGKMKCHAQHSASDEARTTHPRSLSSTLPLSHYAQIMFHTIQYKNLSQASRKVIFFLSFLLWILVLSILNIVLGSANFEIFREKNI